jgi:hypothetical protein
MPVARLMWIDVNQEARTSLFRRCKSERRSQEADRFRMSPKNHQMSLKFMIVARRGSGHLQLPDAKWTSCLARETKSAVRGLEGS